MNELCNLVEKEYGFCEYWETRDERWLRHWNESCDRMTRYYENINKNQPVVVRKATKEEIEKWSSVRENPFRLG